MIESNEKIKKAFLIDDINDLLQIHLDLMEGFKQAIKKSQDGHFRESLQAWHEQHAQHVEKLADLGRLHGGEPRNSPDTGVLATRFRLVIGQVFNDPGLANALSEDESRLALEYERAINSLAALPGMEEVLSANYKDALARAESLRALATRSSG